MYSADNSDEIRSQNRIFQMTGQGWYVVAREGLQGPYFLKAQAQLRLETLLQLGPPRTELWPEDKRTRTPSRPSPSTAPTHR